MCIKFITNKLVISHKPDIQHRIASTSSGICLESFSILIIEINKELDSKDILSDKFDDKICFIQTPFDVMVRYVLLYESGTYEILVRDLSKNCLKENIGNHPPPVQLEGRVSLGCNLFFLVVLIFLTSVLVYFGYVNPALDKIPQNNIVMELELEQTLKEEISNCSIWRSFVKSIVKSFTKMWKFSQIR